MTAGEAVASAAGPGGSTVGPAPDAAPGGAAQGSASAGSRAAAVAKAAALSILRMFPPSGCFELTGRACPGGPPGSTGFLLPVDGASGKPL